jgi:hypothetical protein
MVVKYKEQTKDLLKCSGYLNEDSSSTKGKGSEILSIVNFLIHSSNKNYFYMLVEQLYGGL